MTYPERMNPDGPLVIGGRLRFGEHVTVSEDDRLAVKRGAALLDEHHPGWLQRVDPGDLHVSSYCKCPIGQTLGSTDVPGSEMANHRNAQAFYAEVKRLGVGADEDSQAHGFGPVSGWNNYGIDRAWAEYILEHR